MTEWIGLIEIVNDRVGRNCEWIEWMNRIDQICEWMTEGIGLIKSWMKWRMSEWKLEWIDSRSARVYQSDKSMMCTYWWYVCMCPHIQHGHSTDLHCNQWRTQWTAVLAYECSYRESLRFPSLCIRVWADLNHIHLHSLCPITASCISSMTWTVQQLLSKQWIDH